MKHQQPSHGWLISNRILRWLAMAFMVIFAIAFIAVWSITYSIRRDCSQPYSRNLKLLGYWLHIDMGSTKLGCAPPVESLGLSN